MTAAHAPSYRRLFTPRDSGPSRRGELVLLAAMAVVAVGGAFAVSRRPLLALAVAAAMSVIAFAATNQLAAMSLLAASFLFDNYLTRTGGLVTPAKLIGLLAVGAWLLDWGVRRARVVTSRALVFLVLLSMWLVPATATALDTSAAVVTDIRYVNFAILFFLVLQAVDGDRRKAGIVIDVLIAAATVASLVGLRHFFQDPNAGRATGPIADPNDFGFVLASFVPLVMYRVRWAKSTRARLVFTVALGLIFACILATFSRSALVGLAGAGVWALVARRIRLRWLAAAVLALALSGFAAYQMQPALVSSALTQKKNIAASNANHRLVYWHVALQMWVDHPLVGVGPGGYGLAFSTYHLPFVQDEVQPTTHNAYLNILAELGLPGLVFFSGFLVVAWLHLRRRRPDDEPADHLQTALAAGFVVALVGSLFLTEQYYAPVWLLAALGISLAPSNRTRTPATRSGLVGARR